MATATFTEVVDRGIGDPLTEAIWDDQLKDNINQLGGAHRNQLANGGFEIWQRGTGAFTTSLAYTADRWQLTLGGGSTASISRESSTIDSTGQYSLACTYTHSANSFIAQKIEDFRAFKGVQLTFSMRVRQSVASKVNLVIHDGTVGQSGQTSVTTGSFVTLSVTYTMPSNPVSLSVYAELSGSGTFYFDNAMLVIGPSPAPFRPLHPAEDMARCQRYYEVTIVNYLGSAQGASHTMGQWVPFAVTKAGTPTITKNGTWAVTNCAQPSVGTAAATGLAVFTTSSAAGAVQFVGNSADDTVTAEYNP